MRVGKDDRDYVMGEREAQLFILCLYFLIVAKLHFNKMFVSSKCLSSFLVPGHGLGGRELNGDQGQREGKRWCREEGGSPLGPQHSFL